MKYDSNTIIAYTDGSSTNTGDLAEAGIGVNFEDMGGNRIAELCGYDVGITSNEAEYKAIIAALESILSKQHIFNSNKVIIRSDSQLAVQQIKMEYECKNTSLLKLRNKVHELLARFDDFDVEQIPREQNKIADKLSNRARKNKYSDFVVLRKDETAQPATQETQATIVSQSSKARPTWNEYFMDMAYLTAKRSSCLRRSVGAVLVKNNRVISTGYNGAPQTITPCVDRGVCMREERGIKSGTELQICYALHAEMNALLQCGILEGASTVGSTLYVTHYPCSLCAKMIIQSGIKRVVYKEGYPDDFAKELFNQTDISVEKF